MKRFPSRVHDLFVVACCALFIGHCSDAVACATCYGQSDSPLAAGMNWGILTMIVVAYSVLLSIIGTFIWVARKAAAARALEAETGASMSEAAQESEFHNSELCSKNS